jgi:CheY-like chemotaxis protein
MTKKRILIIDDEKAFTYLVKLNLEDIGDFDVKTENSGLNAVKAALDFKPDLIFLDIFMPDTEGGLIASDIKGTKELRYTPIVFLTAAVRKEELETDGNIIGGHPFIAKPVSTKKLIQVISQYAL